MIKLEIKHGDCYTECSGRTSELLAELSVGTATILDDILNDLPPALKDHVMKAFFESVLMAMAKMEEEKR